jgi:hypothetical protein
MLRPLVGTRVKESRQFSCIGIEACDVWPFAQITGEACPCEVYRDRWSAMFFGDDVVYMKREFRGRFGKVTILAPALRTADDFGFQCAVWTGHALSCSMLSATTAAPWTSLIPAGGQCGGSFLVLRFLRMKARPFLLSPTKESFGRGHLGQNRCSRWLQQRRAAKLQR